MARLFKIAAQFSRIEDKSLYGFFRRLCKRPKFYRVSTFDNGIRSAIKAHPNPSSPVLHTNHGLRSSTVVRSGRITKPAQLTTSPRQRAQRIRRQATGSRSPDRPLSDTAKIKLIAQSIGSRELLELLAHSRQARKIGEEEVNQLGEEKELEDDERRLQYEAYDAEAIAARKDGKTDRDRSVYLRNTAMEELREKRREHYILLGLLGAQQEKIEDFLTDKSISIMRLARLNVEGAGLADYLEEMFPVDVAAMRKELLEDVAEEEELYHRQEDDVVISEDQVAKNAIRVEREEADANLAEAYRELNMQQTGYREAHENFLRQIDCNLDGWTPDWTQTDFDLAWLKYGMKCTRLVREGEEKLVKVMEWAEDAGISPGSVQRHHFPDRASDGYTLSLAGASVAYKPPHVTRWVGEVSDDLLPHDRVDYENYPASVAGSMEEPEPGDSCSCVAIGNEERYFRKVNPGFKPPKWSWRRDQSPGEDHQDQAALHSHFG